MRPFVAVVVLLWLRCGLGGALSLVPCKTVARRSYLICSAQYEPSDPLAALKSNSDGKNGGEKVVSRRKLSLEKEDNVVSIEFIENEIVMIQKELIESISLQLLQNYFPIAEQYAIRGALILLASHIMVLIPVLKFVKTYLNMSTVPYLYIGPILVLLPFIFLFAWDKNITRVDILDVKLKEYLTLLKAVAMETLAKEGDKRVNSLQEYDDEKRKDIVKKLGYMRILSNMDIEICFSDILAAKRSGGASRLTLSPSAAGNDKKSATAFTAVNRILDATSGEEPAALLEKLYEVKSELDKEDSGGSGGDSKDMGISGYFLKMTINVLDALTSILKNKK